MLLEMSHKPVVSMSHLLSTGKDDESFVNCRRTLAVLYTATFGEWKLEEPSQLPVHLVAPQLMLDLIDTSKVMLDLPVLKTANYYLPLRDFDTTQVQLFAQPNNLNILFAGE